MQSLYQTKKPSYFILHIGTNDAPYKFGSDILKNFIKGKHSDCKKITLFMSTIRDDNKKPKKEKNFISSLKESDVQRITKQ